VSLDVLAVNLCCFFVVNIQFKTCVDVCIDSADRRLY